MRRIYVPIFYSEDLENTLITASLKGGSNIVVKELIWLSISLKYIYFLVTFLFKTS